MGKGLEDKKYEEWLRSLGSSWQPHRDGKGHNALRCMFWILGVPAWSYELHLIFLLDPFPQGYSLIL